MDEKSFYQASGAIPENDINKAHKQIRGWKIAALGCLVTVLIQSVFIGYLLTTQNEYVYVAKVKAGEHIEDVVSVGPYVKANKAEKLAFIQQYIHYLMSLSLDPVLVRKNWVDNYQVSGVIARQALSQFIQAQNLVSKVGKETQQVHIKTFNAVDSSSYQFTWDVTTYDASGNKGQTVAWSGVFTLSTITTKRSGISELFDPFGLQVESFSLNQLGA